MLSLEQERRRFTQQAAWTKAIRQYIYQQIDIKCCRNVLEVGCGEGVILADFAGGFSGEVHGFDRRLDALLFASRSAPPTGVLTCGDACCLPYPDAYFDVTLCHFTLLWLKDPLSGLKEMARVTRPGGWVAALAEPDFGGRIDYPEPLASLGRMQALALSRQGADPDLGRQLSGLLHRAGLTEIQTGLLGGQWQGSFSESEWQGEWEILKDDLRNDLTPAEMDCLRKLDHKARLEGERLLFVPTFYGWGRVLP